MCFENIHTNIQAQVDRLEIEIYKIQDRLDVIEGKRKKEIDELFDVGNNTDPDFNRVNVNYTRDDEREYELREKWRKNGDLTDDEKKEWLRINEKYKPDYNPKLS